MVPLGVDPDDKLHFDGVGTFDKVNFTSLPVLCSILSSLFLSKPLDTWAKFLPFVHKYQRDNLQPNHPDGINRKCYSWVQTFNGCKK